MTESPSTVDWIGRAAGLRPEGRLFLGGAYADAGDGRTFTDHTPRDGSVLGDVAFAGESDVDRAVATAGAAFTGWSRTAPAERKRVLLRFAELVREHAEELALLESLDVGKPIREALNVDVPGCANCLQWYAEAIDKRYGEIAPTPPGSLALISREPLGVVAAVVPWNYPLIISAWKIAPALATGNTVILKPAEQSPLSALLLARLGSEAGLPDGVLNVLTGDGPTTGAALGRHPGVAKVAFTGSPEVGRAFLRYAGESNGKAVSVEAGGKSPHVVLAAAAGLDGGLARVADAVAWGVYYNAGQTCHAGSRLLVDERVHDELVAEILARTTDFTVGDPLRTDTVLGAIVDEPQLRRVLDYVHIGQSEGADVLAGGTALRTGSGGTYCAPTVLGGVANSARVAQEEIFGPVLGVVTFRGEDEGVRLANDTRFGLAAAVWTPDVAAAHRVAGRLRAGTVWVNTYDAADVITPFGGFGESGTGRDRSWHALDAYTATKTTWLELR